ncbi:MAG: hypothetical protein ABSC55_28325 [Syntrophorhabdales bacterium]
MMLPKGGGAEKLQEASMASKAPKTSISNDYYLQIDQKRKASFSLPDDWVCAHFVRPQEEEERLPSVEHMLSDALARIDDVPQLIGQSRSLLTQSNST